MSICLSIISHLHGATVDRLLHELAALRDTRLQRVILTLNLPEKELLEMVRHHSWPFTLNVVVNPLPQGFGANHNHAFVLDGQCGASEMFAVLNPDIRLRGNPFDGLLCAMERGDPSIGACYPVQVGDDERPQDHERLLPTPRRLLRRHLLGASSHEVHPGDRPDWVNAAFLLLRREAYAHVGGFDEGYYMYCEDVDLCIRLQLAGWRIVRADDAIVVHGAQRASRTQSRHLLWHVRSLLRLWRSTSWRAYRTGRSSVNLP